MSAHVDFPFHVDALGRTGRAAPARHIRNMIEQVLFTSPGERVNLPTFGCGLREMIFANVDDHVAAATRFLVQGNLEQWLGDVIDVQAVRVRSKEERLVVEVDYIRRDTGESHEERFDGRGGTTGGPA